MLKPTYYCSHFTHATLHGICYHCMFVHPFLHLSQAVIVSKRLNVGSQKQCHTIDKGLLVLRNSDGMTLNRGFLVQEGSLGR